MGLPYPLLLRWASFGMPQEKLEIALADRVCSVCNGNWMRKLDNGAQRVMAASIRDRTQVTVDTVSDRLKLARWALKVGLLLSLWFHDQASREPRLIEATAAMHPNHPGSVPYVPLGDFPSVRKGHRPPRRLDGVVRLGGEHHPRVVSHRQRADNSWQAAGTRGLQRAVQPEVTCSLPRCSGADAPTRHRRCAGHRGSIRVLSRAPGSRVARPGGTHLAATTPVANRGYRTADGSVCRLGITRSRHVSDPAARQCPVLGGLRRPTRLCRRAGMRQQVTRDDLSAGQGLGRCSRTGPTRRSGHRSASRSSGLRDLSDALATGSCAIRAGGWTIVP